METAKKKKPSRLNDWYVKKLGFYITHRKRAMLTSLGLIVVFIGIIAVSGFEMIPAMDESTVSVTAKLPVGTETEEAQHIAEQVVDVAMNTVPEIKDIYYTTGGKCPPGAGAAAKRLAALTGYRIAEPSGAAAYGGLTDYCIEKLGIPAFTLECGKGKNPLPPADAPILYGEIRKALFGFPMLF